MSKGNYTQNERTILEYFFTNVDKNVYCAKNILSSQFWAYLVGQYSRTHVSLRDRFLQLFADQKIALEKWIITQDEYISIDELAESIKQKSGIKLEAFEKKASDFLKKWGVDYGHNSLKDSDTIRIAIEWISQTATKVIESPFPCLGNFQEKSTRYITFGKEGLIFSDQVKNSTYGKEIVDLSNRLIDVYEIFSPIVKDVLDKNNVLKKEEFSSEKVYDSTLNAKVFDIMRYVLPCNVSTSLWASYSARTLETHLSYMLSHPLEEVRILAKSMLDESLQLSPWLLSHVEENAYEITRRKNLDEAMKTIVTDFSENKIYQGISRKERFTILASWNLDDSILASIVFDASWEQGVSYEQSLEIVKKMTTEQKEKLMEVSLADRGKFDRMPRALQHSTFMVEFIMDFGAYRDIQRQRATKQLRQWMTAIHGYDYPEYIDLPGMETFKKAYDEIMMEVTSLSHKVIHDDKYVAQYVWALWHLVRTTFEMDPGQIAYVVELRTTPQWHHSYRNLFIDLFQKIKEIAPMFSKYVRCGNDLTASRKDQEEKTEAKRKTLWL